MKNLKTTTTLLLSALLISSANASDYSSKDVKDSSLKTSHADIQAMVNASLSNYYQNNENNLNLQNKFETTKSETDKIATGLPNNCVPINATQESCDQDFSFINKSVTSGDSFMDRMDISFTTETQKIIRNLRNLPIPTINDFYDKTTDGVMEGSFAASTSVRAGSSGIIEVRLGALSIIDQKVSKKFPVFGCAEGNNAPLKFYNSDGLMIGSFLPSTTQAAFKSTDNVGTVNRMDTVAFDALPFEKTYGYKGSIPNYFGFEVAIGESVYNANLLDEYKTTTGIDADARIIYMADILVSSDTSRAKLNVANYPIADPKWDRYCK